MVDHNSNHSSRFLFHLVQPPKTIRIMPLPSGSMRLVLLLLVNVGRFYGRTKTLACRLSAADFTHLSRKWVVTSSISVAGEQWCHFSPR